MNEVRIGWLPGLHEDEAGNPTDGGKWLLETPVVLRDLEIIAGAGCEVAGSGTHWIERRQTSSSLH